MLMNSFDIYLMSFISEEMKLGRKDEAKLGNPKGWNMRLVWNV